MPVFASVPGGYYSKSFTRKIVLKAGIFLQAIDKANAAGGVWANPKWVLLPYIAAANKIRAVRDAPRPTRKCNALPQPRRGAEEKKKSDVPTYLPFLRFFEIFRSDLRKYFYGVFGLLMQRNGQKRDKKNRWEKTKGKKFFFLNFFGQKFLTCISPKKCFMVFLNSPC